jgi:hypothetical protein
MSCLDISRSLSSYYLDGIQSDSLCDDTIHMSGFDVKDAGFFGCWML